MTKQINKKFLSLFFLICFLFIIFPFYSVNAGCCKDLKIASSDCPNADNLICKNVKTRSECAIQSFWLGGNSCSTYNFCKEIGCCKTITSPIGCEEKSKIRCSDLNFSCFYPAKTCEQITGCKKGEEKGCCIVEYKDNTKCADNTNSSSCLSIKTDNSKQYWRSGRCIEESICKQTTEKPKESTTILKKPKEEKAKPSSPLSFIPSVTIPGSTFVAGTKIPITGNLIGQYISAIFEFFVVLAAFLAVIMIMAAGLLWLIAAGSSDKIGKAKKMIGNAIVGLTLALCTYTILNLVNPDLLLLKNINLKSIERIELIAEEEITSEENPENSELVSIGDLEYSKFVSSESSAFLRQDTAEKLKEVALELHNQGEVLQINNAYRSFENQVALYNSVCKKKYDGSCYPKEQRECSQAVCCPIKNSARCPHQTGKAVDVSCAGKAIADSCQGKVSRAMKKAGFCKLKSEAWHFEYPKVSNGCVEDF
ncbi:MAG: D-alanyl-D-alanine carboxypeptidase family protein [Patescibacteria group bacterium]